MENEAKPAITIAKYKDRIPFDGTVEHAAELHGAGSVYVDGKCYAEILADAAKSAGVVDESPATTDGTAAGDSDAAAEAQTEGGEANA